MRSVCIVFLVFATVPRAAAQSYTFYKVVDDATARPDGKGNFQAYSPALDGNSVVFVQGSTCAGCASPDSIWGFDLIGAKFTKLVDTTTKIPGGAGAFASFDLYPILRKGLVMFRAIDANGHAGLYIVPLAGGGVVRLADITTALPGTSETFSTFPSGGFSHDGTTAVFQASGTSETGVF